MKFSAFDTNHKLGYFDGNPMAAEFETVEVRLGNERAMITEVWPIVDAESYTDTSGTVSTITCVMGQRANATQKSVSYTNTTSINSIGFCPSRSEGRYHRARILVPANVDWEKAKGVDFKFHPTGGR